jgi:D-lyxose ketol-isomerase
MKRSEINRLISEGTEFLKSRDYPLPPQALWSLKDWNKNRDKVAEMTKRRIGWDLTDFGSGEYEKTGLLLYTLSNGIIDTDGQIIDQCYANKLLIIGENQVTPMHHHGRKMEDIIILGGGNLQIKVYNVGEASKADESSPVKIFRNESWESHKPGTVITLESGERVRLDPDHYHQFWAELGKGKVLVEEVSSVNDDQTDNFFLENLPRFPGITEDEIPRYLLCTELPGTEKFEMLVQKYLKA